MNMILDSRRYHYLKRISILLVTLALIAAMVSCQPTCAPLEYTLSILSTLGGSVTILDGGSPPYPRGTSVTLVAVPDPGYRFVEWTGDVDDVEDVTSPTITITMNAAKRVMAVFAAIGYSLAVDSTEGGEVITPGEGTFTYDAGTVVDLLAEAEAGYQFINWTGDVGTIANVNAASTTITMNGDYSITANFEPVPPGQFTLTICSTAGGSVTSPGEGTHIYVAGTVVSLVATPASGYRFVEWTGDVGTIANINAASTTITMNGHYSITANFIAQYNLTINSTNGGAVVTPGEGIFTYDAGTVVDLVAEAEAGYQFINWTGDVGMIVDVNAASTTITMNDDYTITANFAVPIWDWYDLDAVRNNLGASYFLMNDLDSSTAGYEELASRTANGGKGWQPIGTAAENDRFVGSFDGQEHEIRDLFIKRPAEYNVGLFGVVGGGGVVGNVSLMNVTVIGYIGVGGLVGVNDYGSVSDCCCSGNVTGSWQVGGLAGHNSGNVTNSCSTGRVAGWWYVGGLVGDNDEGNVSNCYSSGSVIGGWWVGGLAGHNSGNVSNSYSSGRVTGWWYVGGLVGDNDEGNVSNCYSSGSVTGGWWVGGLAGHNSGNVSNSYSTGSVTGGWCVGGLAGRNSGNVSSSYAIGSVIGGWCVGGLAGHNSGDVNNSYSTGSVTGDECVGGLVGYNDYGTVSNSYSTGSVAGNTHVGGLVGRNENSVSDSYSSSRVSGNNHVGGLVGKNKDTVSDSYSTGRVTGNSHVGGLVGKNEGPVSNSYSTGRVSGKKHVGGLVGKNEGSVSNSYSTGSTTGNSYVGGLVGKNEGFVSNSYAIGRVTGNSDVGGLVGKSENTVSNSFWDTQTSGQTSSSGGTGKTTAEMMDIDTFTGAAWDIITVGSPGERNTAYIWNIVDDETYPFLSWQPI
ncbi:MAG: hypothetical protein HXY36_02765 [Chloroflexi bacterium]|nr:hypothetical protein [Chloroflexota bacterium]